jgi:hypothetical protein
MSRPFRWRRLRCGALPGGGPERRRPSAMVTTDAGARAALR